MPFHRGNLLSRPRRTEITSPPPDTSGYSPSRAAEEQRGIFRERTAQQTEITPSPRTPGGREDRFTPQTMTNPAGRSRYQTLKTALSRGYTGVSSYPGVSHETPSARPGGSLNPWGNATIGEGEVTIPIISTPADTMRVLRNRNPFGEIDPPVTQGFHDLLNAITVSESGPGVIGEVRGDAVGILGPFGFMLDSYEQWERDKSLGITQLDYEDWSGRDPVRTEGEGGRRGQGYGAWDAYGTPEDQRQFKNLQLGNMVGGIRSNMDLIGGENLGLQHFGLLHEIGHAALNFTGLQEEWLAALEEYARVLRPLGEYEPGAPNYPYPLTLEEWDAGWIEENLGIERGESIANVEQLEPDWDFQGLNFIPEMAPVPATPEEFIASSFDYLASRYDPLGNYGFRGLPARGLSADHELYASAFAMALQFGLEVIPKQLQFAFEPFIREVGEIEPANRAYLDWLISQGHAWLTPEGDEYYYWGSSPGWPGGWNKSYAERYGYGPPPVVLEALEAELARLERLAEEVPGGVGH